MNEGTAELLSAIAEYRDMDPQDARMLPPAAYLSDELFEIEMERIFRHEWICVGREEQLPKPGDYFTGRVVELTVRNRITPPFFLTSSVRCGRHQWRARRAAGAVMGDPAGAQPGGAAWRVAETRS